MQRNLFNSCAITLENASHDSKAQNTVSSEFIIQIERWQQRSYWFSNVSQMLVGHTLVLVCIFMTCQLKLHAVLIYLGIHCTHCILSDIVETIPLKQPVDCNIWGLECVSIALIARQGSTQGRSSKVLVWLCVPCSTFLVHLYRMSSWWS